jgi:nucleotide-binding universal stress UspA family protein
LGHWQTGAGWATMTVRLGKERPMKDIVVGVDGSPAGNAALAWAYDEAKLWGATLHVIHVREAADAAGADTELSGALATLPRGDAVYLEARTVTGDAAEVIRAEGAKADLVVLGSHGRRGFVEALLGSVAYKLTHRAPCPVVVVHGER